MLKLMKQFWMPVSLVLVALGLFGGDTAQFTLQLYALSAVAMVLFAAHFTLDDRGDWGLFPYIKLPDLVEKAKETAVGAAVVFASIIYLLAEIINVAVIRH